MFGTRTGLTVSEEAAKDRKRPSARQGRRVSLHHGRLPASPARAHNMTSVVIVQMFSACSDVISRCFQRSRRYRRVTCFCPSLKLVSEPQI